MMARAREHDAQQSHPQPHPAKRGKRGRPKGQAAPMVPLSVRVPPDVLNTLSQLSLLRRTSVKRIVRGILIAAARRAAAGN